MRKITIDNSLKSLAQVNKQKERDTKPNTIKNISLPRKQSKSISQKIKKFIKDTMRGKGLRILKTVMNCYFKLKNIELLQLNKRELVPKKRLN